MKTTFYWILGILMYSSIMLHGQHVSKIIGNDGNLYNMRGLVTIPTADDGVLVGGISMQTSAIDYKIVLTKFNNKMKEEWVKDFYFEKDGIKYQYNNLTDIIELNDGYLLYGRVLPLYTGYTEANGNFFVSKIDKKGNVIFSKELTVNGQQLYCHKIIQTRSGDFYGVGFISNFPYDPISNDYLIIKSNNDFSTIECLTISKIESIAGQNQYFTNIVELNDEVNSLMICGLEYDRNNNKRNDLILVKVDPTKPFNTDFITSSKRIVTNNRSTPKEMILLPDNKIAFLYRESQTNESRCIILDYFGTFISGFDILFPHEVFVARNIRLKGNNLVFSGESTLVEGEFLNPPDIYVMETDLLGNIQWMQKVGGENTEFISGFGKTMFIRNEEIYMTGSTISYFFSESNTTQNMLFFSTSANQPNSCCSEVVDLMVSNTFEVPTLSDISLENIVSSTPLLEINDVPAISVASGIISQDICAPLCTYKLSDIEEACGQLTMRDGEAFINIPLMATIQVSAGVIGLDFTLLYDDAKIEPTSTVELLDIVTNQGLYSANYAINTSTPGVLNIAIYYDELSSNNAGASFQEATGEVASIEFKLKSTYKAGDLLTFTLENMIESYEIENKNECGESGSYLLLDNNNFEGKIIYWNDELKPVGSDTYTGTYGISSSDNACVTIEENIVTPSNTGEFIFDINNGDYLKLNRDIENSSNMTTTLNGTDAYLTGMVVTRNSDFIPSVYQLIAMDVNMNGTVEAGDMTLLLSRSVNSRTEFPQLWNADKTQISKDWLFVDDIQLTDPSFTISSTYPSNDGIGYSRYKVPNMNTFCKEAFSNNNGFCTDAGSMNYHGVLLGDVDGNWNNPAELKSTKSTSDMVVFDLANAIYENGMISIPVNCVKDGLISLDFQMVNYDRTKLTFKSITYGSVTQSKMGFGYSDIIYFSSYAKIWGGINTTSALYYINFETSESMITPEDIGEVTALVCGKPALAVVNSGDAIITDDDNLLQSNCKVYPTPNAGQFTIDLPGGESFIEITDITGKLIFSGMFNENKANVNLSNKGFLFIKITNDNKVYKLKTMIQ